MPHIRSPHIFVIAATLAPAWTAAGCWASQGIGDGGAPGGETEPDAAADADAGSPVDPLDCAGGRYDAASGLCWQHPQAAASYDAAGAWDYCHWLELGGHGDWALPGRDDLLSLLDGCDGEVMGGSFGHCDSCAASATCSALFAGEADWHWTTTPAVGGAKWVVHFDTGLVYWHPVAAAGAVRCVRAGP